MTEFLIAGPHEVPVYIGPAGRIVGAKEGSEFFATHEATLRKGCYVLESELARGSRRYT